MDKRSLDIFLNISFCVQLLLIFLEWTPWDDLLAFVGCEKDRWFLVFLWGLTRVKLTPHRNLLFPPALSCRSFPLSALSSSSSSSSSSCGSTKEKHCESTVLPQLISDVRERPWHQSDGCNRLFIFNQSVWARAALRSAANRIREELSGCAFVSFAILI